MEKKDMNSKFSAELIQAMKDNAPLDWEKAQELGERFGEKPKAIVASANRQGIPYKRQERVSKTGNKPISKAELVNQIADKFGVEVESLDGLEKATKTALESLANS